MLTLTLLDEPIDEWTRSFSDDQNSVTEFKVAFSPSGRALAFARVESAMVVVVDPSTGEDRKIWDAEMREVFGVVWSPDGQRLIAVGEGGQEREGQAPGLANQGGAHWGQTTERSLLTADVSPDSTWVAIADIELRGEPRTPEPPRLSTGPLVRAAREALEGERGDRLLTLLQTVGPAAFVADPTLWGRLRDDVPVVPPLVDVQRRLLHARSRQVREGSVQVAGVGHDPLGHARKGTPNALVTDQLGLPPELLAYRLVTGTLLFRVRGSAEPPIRRPLVVALDVSPATWGPVERLLRSAALAAVDAMDAAALPLRVLLLGGAPRLVDPSDITELQRRLLTERSPHAVRLATSMQTAGALTTELSGGPAAPRILLLSHPDLGRDRQASPASLPERTGLFVSAPNARGRRPWLADDCVRWQAIAADRPGQLAPALRELLA